MRITESDLRRVIKSVILESEDYPKNMESAVMQMTKAFNVLLDLSRSVAFDEFCKIMHAQMGTEGTKFCDALRDIPSMERELK